MKKYAQFEEIAEDILENGLELEQAKLNFCRKHSLDRVPSNPDILSTFDPLMRNLLSHRLRKKPVRTISGVAVVAVMSSPSPCPHGRCTYCPSATNVPQSYTGFEPATMRAKRLEYDPFVQVSERLKQLQDIGHNIEKVELIIMGGTFSARAIEYQEWFLKRCFDALNSFGESPLSGKSLKDSHRINERALVRNVGLTIETRPDYAIERHVDSMLTLGATRVELGVQTLKDRVYEKVKRGHKVEDVSRSTQIAKDAGLKVCYHMMPGLYSSLEEDLEMFEDLFCSPDFKPDMLKIYPLLILEGTELHESWKRGEIKPPDDEYCVNLIVEIKKRIPRWVRTMRIQRDIPADLIVSGLKKGNIGELVQKRLEEEGIKCRCIRCREIGHMARKRAITHGELELLEESYSASRGLEYFISAEDKESDSIAGYLRLRLPSILAHRLEVDSSTAVVRELKILGRALKIGEKRRGAEQHRGIGRRLLEKAEEISKSKGRENLLVLSAVGTREYYRKFGYKRAGPYMRRELEV